MASVFQHRWFMMNVCVFFNKATDGDGGDAQFNVMDDIKKYLDGTEKWWEVSTARD